MDVLPRTVESSFCYYLYHATLYFMKWILHLFAFLFLLVGILKQMAVCFSAEDKKIDAGTYFHNNNFPQSGPALQGCTVNVPVPKAVSS